jgi:hypothetical protein
VSRAARAGLLAACALTAAALAVVPDPSSSPLGRVANVDGDGPDPLYDAPLDAAGIRRAGAIVPNDATYAVDAREASPVVQGNLKAGAQLFLAPALPLQDARRADWLLLYGPNAAAGLGRWPVGRDLALLQKRP